MAIVIPCSHCGKQLRVPQKLRGKSAKCPVCGNALELPIQQDSPPTERLDSGLDLSTMTMTPVDESVASWLEDDAADAPKFDPYYVYLGISTDNESPIDHYGLLGLRRFESNVEIIEMAADRQMGHLQRHESGKHGERVSTLMSEVSHARICLLHPEKKSTYDEQLRSQLDAGSEATAGSVTASIRLAPLGEQESQDVEKTKSEPDDDDDEVEEMVAGASPKSSDTTSDKNVPAESSSGREAKQLRPKPTNKKPLSEEQASVVEVLKQARAEPAKKKPATRFSGHEDAMSDLAYMVFLILFTTGMLALIVWLIA